MSSSDSDVPSKHLPLGAELVQQRKRSGRSLPVKKNKEFRPSGSWLEQRQIRSSLDEISALLEEQRVEKQGSLAKAEWNLQLRKAEVTCRVGAQWNTMGHEQGGKLLLLPEEALFLMETNKLLVYFDGMPMSIQQAYMVLLGSYTGCTLEEYRTYAHLVKQGYILLRHSKNRQVTCYERKIRLHQHTLSQKHSKGKPKSFTDVLVNDKSSASSNKMSKNTDIDVIEYISTNTQGNDKDITSSNKMSMNTDVDIIEDTTNRQDNVKTVAAAVHSHTNLSDIIILDEDIDPSVKNRGRQLSESSSSEFGSVKCETPLFTASRKRKFVDDEVEAIADRKPVVSDLDSECEVLEISTSKKKLKESTSESITQRLTDLTPDMKSEIKLGVANFQSNDLDWSQPSSSNVEVNNIGKHRITNVQLNDTEIEIVPGVMDKAQEDQLRKQESTTNVEVIDLDDDNGRGVKTLLLKKEEKMRILDSLPSVESKFLIHVKAPSQDLLPPNVTPQKKDYYIQLRRLNAAGIGGRPRTAENGEQDNNQARDIESQSEARINPWIARPPEQTELCTLGTNAHPGANFLISQNFGVSPYNMLQIVWQQQLASLVPFMNNPMWNVNLFGMQLPWLQPQMNMWHPPRQNRGRPSWRRPYRGRGRGRFRHQSTQISRYQAKDHASSRNAEDNESSGTIPVQLEDNRIDDCPESKLGISKMKSHDLIDVGENAELVILDDDDDHDDDNDSSDEPITVSSPESSSIRQRERNKQKWKKRGASAPSRCFKPPERSQGLMERLLSETNAEQLVKQGDEDVQKAKAEKVAGRKSLKLGNEENWRDLKGTMTHAMQEVILDSASSEEEAEEEIDVTSDPEPCEYELHSLVQPEDCISIDNVLSKLQIIRSVTMQEATFCASEKIPKISFDVYLPNTSFRKTSPGLPKYRIVIARFQEHMPPFEELAKMMKPFQDDVPLVFAVLSPESITFFQVGSVNLPIEVTFPDVI